jgi:hypothetical protein
LEANYNKLFSPKIVISNPYNEREPHIAMGWKYFYLLVLRIIFKLSQIETSKPRLYNGRSQVDALA